MSPLGAESHSERTSLFVCRHKVVKLTCLYQATWGNRVRFSHRLLGGVGGGVVVGAVIVVLFGFVS